MSRVDELENADSVMAVMKLEDAIDECSEKINSQTETIDGLVSNVEDITYRLDNAEVTIEM